MGMPVYGFIENNGIILSISIVFSFAKKLWSVGSLVYLNLVNPLPNHQPTVCSLQPDREEGFNQLACVNVTASSQ